MTLNSTLSLGSLLTKDLREEPRNTVTEDLRDLDGAFLLKI